MPNQKKSAKKKIKKTKKAQKQSTGANSLKTDQERRMKRAYRIATEMAKDKMLEERPDDAKILVSLEESDLVVIKGDYDHIEVNLEFMGMPFITISPRQIDSMRLRDDQMVFVNCPGHLTGRGIKLLSDFVERGGFLFSTDWALKHVLEPAFPGYVRFNRRETGDEVVRVQNHDPDNPHVQMFLGPEDDPVWWLEGSSYPIEIQDKKNVRVLISSKELKNRYGEAPVLITFQYGQGTVFHMISHFYLQRSETRTERHSAPSTAYATEKGYSEEQQAKYRAMGAEEVTTAEVESALHSQTRLADMILAKKKQDMEKMRRKEN